LRSEDALESSIRDSALTNVAKLRRAPDNEGEAFATNLGQMVQRVSGASLSEIDRLVDDLHSLREHIEGEGARVQRTLAEFAHLSQSSARSTSVIAEALSQLKRDAGRD
jgi:hypothetical protein